MKHKVKKSTQEEITLDERELEEIVRAEIVRKFGWKPEDFRVSLYQYRLPIVMGQIDDEYAIGAEIVRCSQETQEQ